ncbi:DUF3679 domain-containing protein [Paenibacillus chondroitinus]|uniref:DUF3679 domain-containing protein n=1 Tax=Paenibacillus chondroitinus TaxID=59842 RepID=A0ABU6DII7_9BACL|nr:MULTISPECIES: DUF3679 domain-containing protein [Paenibacillus]MCY9658468.1 YqxA family protein [Paenibacillus anseongense]MEB4797180.1 DUF3679 domain-containing protein [Paenibacillus chondroitinus]
MKLRHFYIKVSLFGLLLLFCILFGVSLASSGMERIQGPQPSAKAAVQDPVKPTGKGTAAAASAGKATTSPAPKSDAGAKTNAGSTAKPETEKQDPVADHDNSLNHVGNKLGDLLQIASHHGIKLFVSIFDAILGKG